MQLVLATTNVHKIREFRDFFKSLNHIDLLSLLNFPDYVPPEETGVTFAENAALKAIHAAQTLNILAVADDSGLVVPALTKKNGETVPGVYSRRYAGLSATDSENRKKLLAEMRGLSELERAAYFECSLAIASPDGLKKSFSAICEGMILEEERGSAGFGYDPLFIKHDYDKSFGELEERVKNRISHRGKAFEKLSIYLESFKS